MSDPREGLWHTHQDCKDCDQNAERIVALQYALDGAEARVKELETLIQRVANEANCRAEHGADGADHLRYIERALRGEDK